MIFRVLCRHTDCLTDRDASGTLIRRCTDCGKPFPVLQSEIKRDGPAHVFQLDMGARTMKAQRVTKGNVRTWKRSER